MSANGRNAQLQLIGYQIPNLIREQKYNDIARWE
jgi:hypothetical protein